MGSRRRCCCHSVTINLCVTACGVGLVGAVITVAGVGSCTTIAGGCCQIAGLTTGTHSVTITFNGSTIFSGSRNIVAGTNTFVASLSNIVCCGGYYIPFALTLTDAIGALAMWYNSAAFNPTWYACRQVSLTASNATVAGGICTVNTPTTLLVNICYVLVCQAPTTPILTLLRAWSWVYEPGTLTPIYFASGLACPTPSLTATCVTSAPGPCGGGNDSSSGSANPSSSSPFAASFTMTPNGANATADPVGGNCTVTQ